MTVEFGVVDGACKQIAGNRFNRSGCRWPKAGANALLTAECSIENDRRVDFLDWKACHAAAA